MRLVFKRGRPVNWNGLTMACSICYSEAAEMKLSKPKKRIQASKRLSTTDCNKVSNGYVTFSRDRRSAEVRSYTRVII